VNNPAMVRTNAAAPEDAYEQLRSQIVDGALMPNERLVETDLAERLGVGRAAVRTFLTRLEQEGLVVREPNRGARVRMVTEAEAVEITQTRMVLEALAAREAADRATRDEVAQMRAVLAEMEQRLTAGELLLYSDGNARLHALILRASRHATATRLISSLKAQTVRFQYRTVLVPGRPQHSYAEHTAIVDAIDAGDADAAEAAMRLHLSHVTKTLRETHAQQ
jgi:DNA-binding GntR family transcriptional regulator